LSRVGIIGAGAWGTALACQARTAGHDVVLWARDPDLAETINRTHENQRLPGIRLDATIRVTADLGEVTQTDVVLLAVPAQHLRGIIGRAAPGWRDNVPAVVCAKGIEQRTLALMTEVAADVLPRVQIGVLSGPSFAAEVALRLPTALVFAASNPSLRAALPAAMGTKAFRVYASDDVIGAEIGGAVKNVLAIACGIVKGRGLGDNARASLITRGLAEMSRLAVAKGARPLTLMGLSGLGDLTLTCNASQSRNFSLGVALGTGEILSEILTARVSITEGLSSAAAVSSLARNLGIDMPICFAVDAILNSGADLDATIAGLLARPPGSE
jgi:glycerol-3-phosphate dehydrogenase (NAD(P)+)